ncbi:hypothetical protein GLOIN_2v1772225 [Rhizophagus clarus]|nr:hypothetical protein GLOIN_2v1772225 [Rhizophagus clarus]
MMPQESKEFLKINGLKYLFDDESLNNDPLFNYARFCKVIDSFVINSMVIQNIKYNKNQKVPKYLTQQNYNEYLVEQEILKLLINNTSKIKCLTLIHKSHPIIFFSNSFTSLSQLNELHCNTSIDPKMFYELSQFCKNIEKLVIEGHNDENYGLVLFIEKLSNLKKVKIWEDNVFGSIAQGKCKNLGDVLVTKSSSITELDLGNSPITIPPKLLRRFQNNLTSFKFCVSYHISEEILINELVNILRNISFPNLEELIIYHDYSPPFEVVARMIETTNKKLKKFTIGTFNEFYENANLLVTVISTQCPKLEYLGIWIDDMNLMINLLNGCKNLKGLLARSYYSNEITELFKILGDHATNQLRKFQFDETWELAEDDLKNCFEIWKQKKEFSFDFYMPCYVFQEANSQREIIKKYQKLGVIGDYDMYPGARNYVEDIWE